MSGQLGTSVLFFNLLQCVFPNINELLIKSFYSLKQDKIKAKQIPKKSEIQGQTALQSLEYQRVGGYKSIKG